MALENKKLSTYADLTSANIDTTTKLVVLTGATKVNANLPITNFIEDSLTSTSVVKPLSANQGKILKTFVDDRIPSTGSISGQILVGADDNVNGWQTPTKSLVGLGNVDNTSDANKPISTAQGTGLAPKANPTFTGDVTLPNVNCYNSTGDGIFYIDGSLNGGYVEFNGDGVGNTYARTISDKTDNTQKLATTAFVQAQKDSPTFTGTVTATGATIALGTTGNITADGKTISSTEIASLDGIVTTTNIQYQLDGKMDSIELVSITTAPVTPVTGTYYYNSTTKLVYLRVSGSWQVVGGGNPSESTVYIYNGKLYIGDVYGGGSLEWDLVPIVNTSPTFVDVTATNSVTSTIYNAGPTALGGGGVDSVSAEIAFGRLNALLPYIDESIGIVSYVDGQTAGATLGANKFYINTTNKTLSLSEEPA